MAWEEKKNNGGNYGVYIGKTKSIIGSGLVLRRVTYTVC